MSRFAVVRILTTTARALTAWSALLALASMASMTGVAADTATFFGSGQVSAARRGSVQSPFFLGRDGGQKGPAPAFFLFYPLSLSPALTHAVPPLPHTDPACCCCRPCISSHTHTRGLSLPSIHTTQSALPGPGACGYGPDLPPTLGPVAALSPASPLLAAAGRGGGCGSCVEVACADASGTTCRPGAAVVATLADTCAGCAPSQINVHASVYASLGADTAASPTLPAVSVRTVPCPARGGVAVRVRGGGGPPPSPPSFLFPPTAAATATPAVVPIGLASPGGARGGGPILEAVAIRPVGGGEDAWAPLAHSFGGVWEVRGVLPSAAPPAPHPTLGFFPFAAPPPPPPPPSPLALGPGPFDVRLTGEGGAVLVLPGLVPTLDEAGEWVSGANFVPAAPAAPAVTATAPPPVGATPAPPPATAPPPVAPPPPPTPAAAALPPAPPGAAGERQPAPGETVAPLPPPAISDGDKLNLKNLNAAGSDAGGVGAVVGEVGVMSVG
jgi:hypothetical protein